MSTERTTLADFDGEAAHVRAETPDIMEGARYRRAAPSGERTTSGPTCVCLNCGESVPARVGRVLGNNDDNVPVCKHCHTGRKDGDFHTTGAAIKSYRSRDAWGRL